MKTDTKGSATSVLYRSRIERNQTYEAAERSLQEVYPLEFRSCAPCPDFV